MYISESEALRLVFSEGARPSLKSFQRYRRELGLPCYHFGKRIMFDREELEAAIKDMKRPGSDS